MTGSVPGCARQMGQIFTLGLVSSGSLLELQNIFVFVLSSAWSSSPIVGTYSDIATTLSHFYLSVPHYSSYSLFVPLSFGTRLPSGIRTNPALSISFCSHSSPFFPTSP